MTRGYYQPITTASVRALSWPCHQRFIYMNFPLIAPRMLLSLPSSHGTVSAGNSTWEWICVQVGKRQGTGQGTHTFAEGSAARVSDCSWLLMAFLLCRHFFPSACSPPSTPTLFPSIPMKNQQKNLLWLVAKGEQMYTLHILGLGSNRLSSPPC